MNTNHKQKFLDKPLKKTVKYAFTMFLTVLAAVAGIQLGNLLYKLDLHIINSIDTNNFKNIISLSIPIVESVYNSGKYSVSFSGEVKELLTRVFGFDLDSPASIFNAQSPIFKSYYRIKTMKELSIDDEALSGHNSVLANGNGGDGTGNGTGSSGAGSANGGDGSGSGNSGGDIGSSGTGSGSSGSDNSGSNSSGTVSGDGGKSTGNRNSGNSEISGGDAGNGNSGGGASGSGKSGDGTGSGNGGNNAGSGGANRDLGKNGLIAGQLDGAPESSMSFGTEYGIDQDYWITSQMNNGTNQANNGTGQTNSGIGQQSQDNRYQTGSSAGGNQIALGIQPISSVSYETEDDKEGDENETVELDKIQIKNYTNHKIDIAKLLKEPLKINMSKKGPKVLIYHTHTSESYVLKEADLGKKDVPSFNTNPKYNVVRVGEELARYLEKYGIETLHNGTVHDKVHDAAYGVSINTLQSYKKSYPSIQVYIDIHRDAVDSEKPKLRMTKEINGKNCAQIMFVVGADGMLPHPEWKENLKFVLKLQQKLNEKYPGLARPVRIVGKRYNQQISNNAILIEVGGDGNLLSECIESTKYLAEVLNDVMKSK